MWRLAVQRSAFLNYRSKLLPLALIVLGAGLTVVALAADVLQTGSPQGIGPRQVSLALVGFAITLTGVVLVASVSWRNIGLWILVGSAVVAVLFASDLLVINGLPEFGAKHIVLAVFGLSVITTSIAPATPVDWRNIRSWLSRERTRILQFFSLVVQLGLLVLVVGQLNLENQAVYRNLMLLTFYGFVIHYFLPQRFRLAFFLLLSLAAISGILGFVNGFWLIGIGLLLIGICHLPLPYTARLLLLLVAGVVLALMRVGWIPASWLDVIWPVLASMFMFRLIIYLYDLKHGKATPTLTSTLAYFFLLPNVVFPFFPVVDYSTFRRTYYDEDQHVIYQRGLQWMLRGVIHLVLYRFVNYYLMISPEDVTNTAELVRFLVANFALYLRISGIFHLAVGILHLFGFNLPETNHLYFLSSSFTDLWRRINIYWKDFMMKVFYYPAYFRIRQWGAVRSLALATAFVFFMTWFLHAYQWFWLRGTFLLTAPDALFWLILSLLVIGNTLYEARRGRKRSLGKNAMTGRDLAPLALRTAITFSSMAVLWSLWNSNSILDWIALISVVELTWESMAVLALSFLSITLVFGLSIWLEAQGDLRASSKSNQFQFSRAAAVTGGSVFLLLLAATPAVYSRLGSRAQAFFGDLTVNRLSSREAGILQRGYYEDLAGVNQFNSQLWDIYSKRPSDWPTIFETEVARQTDDNLINELVPSKEILFQGAQLSTNRWGMRDQDYERASAPGTYRIALVGPSFVMGTGVADEQVFEHLLEDRLNQEYGGKRYNRYEILNFAVAGYSAIQNLIVLDQKILPFKPQALFFVAHQREQEAAVLYLADRITAGAELSNPELEALADQAGASAGQTKEENTRRLQPVGREILSLTYQQIANLSRSRGVLPVWIFFPTLEAPLEQRELTFLTGVAEQAGFVVIDLSAAYAHQDLDSLVVAYWDKHPNVKGHGLIAGALYQALLEKAAEIPLFP